LEGGEEIADILQKAAFGSAQLQRTGDIAPVVRTALPDAMQARDLAHKANASNSGKD
jgi:hypothetical protein